MARRKYGGEETAIPKQRHLHLPANLGALDSPPSGALKAIFVSTGKLLFFKNPACPWLVLFFKKTQDKVWEKSSSDIHGKVTIKGMLG